MVSIDYQIPDQGKLELVITGRLDAEATGCSWPRDDGGIGVDTLTVTVNNVAPAVDVGPDQTVDEGDVVNFSGSFTDPGSADTHTVDWDFGDASIAGGTLTPSHVYADNGIYTVALTVTDDDGGIGVDTLTVTVNNVAPAVDVGPDQTVDEGDVVNFSGSFTDPGSADTHTIDWDFGDSTADSGTLTPSHVYADNGTYTVTVTVTDDDGDTSSDTLAVTVSNVAPAVDAGSDQTVDEGDVVNFSGSFTDPGSADTHTVDWDFGDASIAGGTLTPSHVYADNGIYTVALTVTDDDGGVGTDTLTVTVNNVAPTVNAGSDQTVDEGDTISLDPATFNDLGTLDTHTATIDWGDGTAPKPGTVTESPFGPPGSASGANGTVSASHVYADNGVYTVTVTVTDDDGGVAVDTFDVSVENIAPAASVDIPVQAVQYSDAIAEVTITATDVEADVMNATVAYTGPVPITSGLPDAGTLPGGIELIGDPNQVGMGVWTLAGIADVAPGTYIIRVTVYDEDGGSTDVDITIDVLQEDAAVTYNGPGFVSTPSVRDSVAIVELRAVIQDITAVDPVSDPDSGNITYANVTFVNRDNGDIIAADIPVELLDSDIMTGIVSYEWEVDIGSSDSVTFTIGIIVDGYYTRDRAIDNMLVTVSKPIENSVTGGGYLINEYSDGVFAGDANLKTNFGFNVKFNKKLANLQGHVNIIIRQDDRVYQVKTNAMRSLVADPETNEAIFISKANLIDITDPNNPISVAGNLTLLISLTDRGDSPSSDSIGITLWKRNELWFSSNWTGTETIEQMLAGGNLVIHGHRK